MPNVYEGTYIGTGLKFAIVSARFNGALGKELLAGAIDTLVRHDVADDAIDVVHVPGAFEIPLAAKALVEGGTCAAVVCLGAVIQGQTTHHDYINHSVANAIMELSQSSSIPVTFGVLTCQTMEQALDRAGGKVGNKGHEATLAAIEMVNVPKEIPTAE